MSSYLYHLPYGIQSSVSGLSNSDLAYIQEGDWFPELSHLVEVTGSQDIDTNLDNRKFRDEGEKIDIFIHTALNPHTRALETLGTFLEKKDLAILAATLQGFASIGRILKKSDLPPAYRRHLKDLKTHLTANLNPNHDADPSVQLFKLLCEQAESGKSDLISLSAVNTLQQLEYPESLRIDLLDKKPAEIEADILQKNISRLSNNDRSYSRDNPCQDWEYIKFWVYGPTEILLSVCNGTYYIDVVREVLRKSGIRGIRLALQGGNINAIREAVNFAGEIFNQINPSSADKRYIDKQTRQKLASLLIPFINHSDIELRNLVADKLNDGSNGYKVSDHLLDDSNRAKVAVIDTTSSEKWKRVVALGNLSIPVLCEAIGGKLKFVDNENQNTNSQIEALKSIDKILKDIPKKASTLSQYLSHPKDKIKLETFHLLKNHWAYLDEQSIKLLIQIALRILDWNSLISFGHRSILFLRQIVEGKLILRKDEESNINCQIEALNSIDIIINDIDQKIRVISPYLQHDNDTLSMEVAKLLKDEKEHLDTNSRKILTALLFEPYMSQSLSNLEDLARLKERLESAQKNKTNIENIFGDAIFCLDSQSSSTKQFLTNQKNKFINKIIQVIKEIERQKDLREQEENYNLELIKVPYFTMAVILICLFFEIWFIPPRVVDHWLSSKTDVEINERVATIQKKLDSQLKELEQQVYKIEIDLQPENVAKKAKEEVNQIMGEEWHPWWGLGLLHETEELQQQRRLREENTQNNLKQNLTSKKIEFNKKIKYKEVEISKQLSKEQEKMEIEVPKQVKKELSESTTLSSTIGCVIGFNLGMIAGYLLSIIISLLVLNANTDYTHLLTLTFVSGFLIILIDIFLLSAIASNQPSNLVIGELSNSDFINSVFNWSIIYSALISFNFGFISPIDILQGLLRVGDERLRFAIGFVNNSKIEFLLTLILGYNIAFFMVFGNSQFLVLSSSILGFLTIQIMKRQRTVNERHKRITENS